MNHRDTKTQRDLTLYPKYESYKDSGVEWLGEVPFHWGIERAKWLFYKAERPVEQDDEIVTCFRDGEVTLRRNRRMEGFTNALKEHGYQRILKGDLVIHAMDAFAGAIGVSDSDGKSSPVYSACVPKCRNSVNQYFYAYYLRNVALSGYIESLAKGIRERSTDFRFKDFSEMFLPKPPVLEQSQIASFLDRKTSQIDQAVAIKEKQIALLKERKQILIQNAVTQGLNPNAPMKDSGIDWIGQIPKHWSVVRLKALIKALESGVSVNASESEAAQGFEIGVLKTSAVYSYSFSPKENKKVFKSEINRVSCPVKANSIIISRMNAPDLVGASGYVDQDFPNLFLPDRLWQARFFNEDAITSLFVSKYLITLGFRAVIESIATGSSPSMKNISKGDLLNQFVALPPLKEQSEIVEYIETQSQKIDEAIALQQQQIEKLKEYKTTLINSAVTGKIKIPPEMTKQDKLNGI